MQIVHAAVQVSHEYAGQNDSTNEVKIVLTYLIQHQDLHCSTVYLPSPESFVAVISPGTTQTEQFGKLAVTLHFRRGRPQMINPMHLAYDPIIICTWGSQG